MQMDFVWLLGQTRQMNLMVFDERYTSVALLVDGMNHQFFSNCGKLGSLSLDNFYTFSCTTKYSVVTDVCSNSKDNCSYINILY